MYKDRMLRLPEVSKKVGKSRATIYRDVREGVFPRPYCIGRRAIAWSEAEMATWLADRPTTEGRAYQSSASKPGVDVPHGTPDGVPRSTGNSPTKADGGSEHGRERDKSVAPPPERYQRTMRAMLEGNLEGTIVLGAPAGVKIARADTGYTVRMEQTI